VREESAPIIARDIHDELGQALTRSDGSFLLTLKSAKRRPQIREQVQELSAGVDASSRS